MSEFLVRYEYAAKQDKGAGVNHRWQITPDGRFERSQNPKDAVRPATAGSPYWYATEWSLQKQLSAEELADVAAIVASAPIDTRVVSPPRATHRGDWSRLSLTRAGATVVFEVEDRCTDEHERWLGQLVDRLMPEVAALRAKLGR